MYRRILSAALIAIVAIAITATAMRLPSSQAAPVNAASAKCGVERWPVKTGSDPDIEYLFKQDGSLKKVRNSTIQKLIDAASPSKSCCPNWRSPTSG